MDVHLTPDELEQAIEEFVLNRLRLPRDRWTTEDINEEEGTIRIRETED